MEEKLMKLMNRINEEFQKRGYEIEEDLKELIETNETVASELANTKFKKIEFFDVKDENSVGFTLEDLQVSFYLEYGEDEEGPWYEATAEIVNF
ncbi:MAG: hypothetical protein Q7K36_03150, partial [Fusobacterium sp. JB020]|nr:hypothetical protein [Fusobacterium sp. JB020]